MCPMDLAVFFNSFYIKIWIGITKTTRNRLPAAIWKMYTFRNYIDWNRNETLFGIELKNQFPNIVKCKYHSCQLLVFFWLVAYFYFCCIVFFIHQRCQSFFLLLPVSLSLSLSLGLSHHSQCVFIISSILFHLLALFRSCMYKTPAFHKIQHHRSVNLFWTHYSYAATVPVFVVSNAW